MPRNIPLVSVSLILLTLSARSIMACCEGENYPTVQSALDGTYYVRSIPSEDFGDKGHTQVFKVTRDTDQIMDEYPVYMRGQLFLGRSPIAGKWCLVHLEPKRVQSDIDYLNIGKISRLTFYMGGEQVFSYTTEDLLKFGLRNHVSGLQNHNLGEFMVHGIEQIPLSNYYVLTIEKTTLQGKTEKILFDITTGKIFTDASEKNSKSLNHSAHTIEQSVPGNPPQGAPSAEP